MAQTRVTTYTCDHCGKKVAAKKLLRRFSVSDVPWRASVSFDVCDDCEDELLGIIVTYTPDDDLGDLVRA